MNRPRNVRPALVALLVLPILTGILFGSLILSRDVGSAGAAPQPGAQNTQTEAIASPVASQALARLQAGTLEPIQAHVSRQTSVYDFVRAGGATVLAADTPALSPEARARAFLSANGDLVGMTPEERAQAALPGAASNLQVKSVNTDQIGSTHVKFKQTYQGLKVFGAEIVVHMSNSGITAINGNFVPGIKSGITPKVTEAQAKAKALQQQVGNGALTVVGTELSIYRTGLLEGFRGESVLAYGVEITNGKESAHQIWIDAVKGAVLNRISLTPHALNRIIYTPEYDNDGPFAVRHEGDPLTPGPTPGTTGADPINNLYVFAGHTYNLYRSGFGRDSFNGTGGTMHSVLLVNDACPNAYWNGISTNYCPDFDADDVVSHEWSHGYTQFTHGLIYSYQSGALNESYSDIFGETVDLLNGVDAEGGSNNAQPMDGGGQRWQMGEDVNVLNEPTLGILRDMWNPTNYGDPDKVSSAQYACGSGDGGGVHTNSGVPNHAYAMLVDGKTFNGQTVGAIGFTRAAAIYYRAMTVYQTPTTDFPAHAQALQASCNDLLGVPLNGLSTISGTSTPTGETITASTCQQVAKALLAVEMSLPTPCPTVLILDPDEPVACDGSADIFAENWETGMDGWTKTSTGVTGDWNTDDGIAPGSDLSRIRNFNLTTTLPVGGGSGSALYGKNPQIGEDGGGTCSPGGDYSGQYTIENTNAITIPAGVNDVELRFDHYVATEAGYDGAQVELSVNGGAFALVPEAEYLFNGPNANLTSVIDANTNPNAGEPAWTGTNVGMPSGSPPGSWGTTIIDLRNLTNPGDTIKLRFTFSQDGCNGNDGWYVDNIRVYSCPTLQAPVLSLGPDYTNPDPNGSYTLNWIRPVGATGPDVLQESSVCEPLLTSDGSSLTGWTAATGASPDEGQLVFPMWQTAPAGKPQYNNATFWANPVSEQETQNTFATLTYNSPISIPPSGITTMSFSEWYFNEDDDKGTVEVSTDNGTTWTAIYTNNRAMGDLPDTGAAAFADEGLTRQNLDLTIYSGQTIRLRFKYSLGQSNFFFFVQYGWYIDDISIVNDSFVDLTNANVTSFLVSGRSNGTRCYRARTSYDFGSGLVRSPYSNLVSATTNVVCSVANVALSSAGAVAVATSHSSGNFPALAAINGDRTGATWGSSTGGWNDNTRNAYPDIFEVDFAATESINQINVFTLQNNWTTAGEPTAASPATGEGILDFVVQYCSAGCGTGSPTWTTVTGGNVTGNDKAMRTFGFTPVTTSKIRVVVNNSRNNWSRIVEVEAYRNCP